LLIFGIGAAAVLLSSAIFFLKNTSSRANQWRNRNKNQKSRYLQDNSYGKWTRKG
jgi:mannose/cellobiose epimerase-like protein (N-acyl-D-glucosamine 2-epimerase family)